MAIRNFDLLNNTIFVQFQYAKDAITASTRIFSKPPKADYGCETVFNPADTKAYNVYDKKIMSIEISSVILFALVSTL